jgi:methyl-accepting chemotaxis protein
MTSIAKALSVVLLVALAGCTDLKPTQATLDDLKSQVDHLKSMAASAQAASQAATSASRSAQQAAGNAQSTANQALALDKTNQSSIDAINDKVDRMFRKRLAK